MKTHYDILGVPEDATADEIKKAYRRKAKATHPDAGGKQSDFEPVVQAWETLSDPNRRQLYDATGEDRRPPIETEVENSLMQGFAAALQAGENVRVVEYVHLRISAAANQVPADIKKLKGLRAKLKKKRSKIQTKGNVNLVHRIIDNEIKCIDGTLVNLEHQAEVAKACLAALEEYVEEPDRAAPSAAPQTFSFDQIFGNGPYHSPFR